MITGICEKLRNKKVLLLGFGREGKSTYHFIRKYLPEMQFGIYDKNEIKDSLENATQHIGNSYQDILADYDMIIKSPGIVFNSKDNGDFKKLTSQTDLFLEFYRDQTIGITGTKGKSTTSSLVYHVIQSTGRDARLVGNIGVPVFDVLEEISDETLIVFELSSHQLEHVTHSPHIGMHLNLYQEHLDHYGTFEKYAAAKENIYKFMQKGDLLIYNKGFLNPGKHLKAASITLSDRDDESDVKVKENHIYYKEQHIEIIDDEILLKGHHNVYNIAAAYSVANYLGVGNDSFYEAVKTFQPLPHRMEYVAVIDGITFYNDSISTICETTIQAAMSIRNIDTVILGGMDRGIEYKPLVDFLLDSEIRNIILMPDTGYRIQTLIANADAPGQDKNIVPVANVEEAVQKAKEITKKGMTCLFSPAAASYGFFKNFEERGEVFKKFVLSNEICNTLSAASSK
ncbi:MAG: murD [Herbinix sp.]|jgi:UDP-N-acetylmuramoylalanine--D-glutamate ligase|nr:murD [Herbinix sp.]